MNESLPGNPTVTNLYAQSPIHAFDAIKREVNDVQSFISGHEPQL